jgi:hypothetical protein
MSGSPVSVTRATATFMRRSGLGQSKGEPLGETRNSDPVSCRHSHTSSFQMSSQIGTPMRTPRNDTGPGSGPWSNTRFSSNTP